MAAASPTVTATVDTGVDVVPARQKSERDPELAESTKDVGRRIREGDAFADKHAKFALAYSSLLSLLVVGLGLAGLSSTRWLSYRVITQSPNGPSMAFHHLGLWSECGPNGCTHVNAVDAPQFVNVARGFGILFVCLGFISWLLVTVASAKVGAATGTREGGAHRDMAKLAGNFWLLTGFCGIIAMSTFVAKRHDQLLTAAGVNNVFWDWSFAVFTSAWAAAVTFIAPLCFIAS